MIYNSIVKGRFISRPNRFIAYAEIDGKEEICHVKNTGRCRELLIPEADIILEISDNPNRNKYRQSGAKQNCRRTFTEAFSGLYYKARTEI